MADTPSAPAWTQCCIRTATARRARQRAPQISSLAASAPGKSVSDRQVLGLPRGRRRAEHRVLSAAFLYTMPARAHRHARLQRRDHRGAPARCRSQAVSNLTRADPRPPRSAPNRATPCNTRSRDEQWGAVIGHAGDLRRTPHSPPSSRLLVPPPYLGYHRCSVSTEPAVAPAVPQWTFTGSLAPVVHRGDLSGEESEADSASAAALCTWMLQNQHVISGELPSRCSP